MAKRNYDPCLIEGSLEEQTSLRVFVLITQNNVSSGNPHVGAKKKVALFIIRVGVKLGKALTIVVISIKETTKCQKKIFVI